MWPCHWGLDVPSRSRCPTMAWVSHHDSATLSPPSPAMPSRSSCVIGLQVSHWGPDVLSGSRCPTMVQMFHHNPAVLSPFGSAMLSCSGQATELQMCHLSSRCPTETWMLCPVTFSWSSSTVPPWSGLATVLWIRVWVSHHNPATLSLSVPAVPPCSGHAIGVWVSHYGPGVSL